MGAVVSGGAVGAVVREGGNTTEATTTSTTAVDILSVASLTIAAAEPFMAVGNFRKTNATSANMQLGLKLNTTQVINNELAMGATATAKNGVFFIRAGARVASYLRAILMEVVDATDQGFTNFMPDADMPTVQITDLVVTGLVNSGLITGGVDEVQVFSYASA